MLASRRLARRTRFGAGLGAAAAAADRGSLLAVPLQQPGGEGAGARARLLPRASARSTTTQLELAAPRRGGRARRARAQRALRARARAHARSRSGSRGPAASWRASSTRTTCSTVAVRHAVELLGADGASVRMLEGDEVVVRAAAGRGRARRARHPRAVDGLARRRHRPDARRRGRSPTSGTTRGWARPTRCSPPATRAISACRWSAPRSRSTGILAVYSTRPREWREEEVEALLALAATAATARVERRALPGRQPRAAAQRGDPRQRRRRDRRRRPRGQGRALEPGRRARHRRLSRREALGQTPTEALGRPLEAAEGVARRQPARCRSGAAPRRSGSRSAKR